MANTKNKLAKLYQKFGSEILIQFAVIFFALLLAAVIVKISPRIGQNTDAKINLNSQQYFIGRVQEITSEGESNEYGEAYFTQDLLVKLPQSQGSTTVAQKYQASLNSTQIPKLHKGDDVIMTYFESVDGRELIITDVYRLDNIIIIFVVFFSLTVLFTGYRGITSIFGLGFSIFVIIKYVVPFIVAGYDPVFVSFSAAMIIVSVSIFLAHGVKRRTLIALISTVTTIFITTILAVLSVKFVRLFGIGTEEALFLSTYLGEINLQGLLLGGIILGTLGVLDDVTTAQTAAVAELKAANPKLTMEQLYERAGAVGKEHILSLVNTLVLAYVGTSFPILLLFSLNDSQPLWVTLNSEFIIEEIIRSLIGSIGLIFAVPITNLLASYVYTHLNTKFPKWKKLVSNKFFKS